MKQLCSTYSISGSSVTLTGVNVPLSQILLVSDATTGNVLYSMAGPAATSYTQGANSTMELATAPGSSDNLTIYYDDGVAPANAPSSVSVSNLPATQPVSGTVTAGRNWNLSTSSDSLTAAVSSLPAVSLAGGQSVGVSSLPAVSVSNFPAFPSVQNVSLVGDSLGSIPASLTAAVSLASGQSVGVSSLPAISGNVGITSLPSVTVSNPTTGTPTLGAAVSLASGQNVGISSLPAVSVSNFPATQPVSGTVSVSGTVPVIGTFYQATQPVSGTLTANVQGGNSTAVKVDGSAVTQPVSGTVTVSNPQTSVSITGTPTVSVQGGNATAVKVDGSAVTQPVSGTVTATISGTPSVTLPVSSTPTVSTFTSITSATVLAASASTKAVTIFNGSTATAYILLGAGTASSSNYSFYVVQGDLITITGYTGQINGILSASGTINITALT